MQNLFAACRKDKNDALSVYHVPLDAATQSSVKVFFEEQQNMFVKDIDEEIPYNGMWKPDGNQIITIEVQDCSEAKIFQEAIKSPIRIDSVDVKNFAHLGIRALFTGKLNRDNTQIFIQKFTKKQMLEHKCALCLNKNVFNRLTETAFSLDDKLSAVIDGDIIKFRSFHILRTIMNVMHLFKEAIEEETKQFAQNPIFSCASTDNFLKLADEPTRKMITLILKDGILNIDINIIKTAAKEVKCDIKIENDKIVMPTEKKEIKRLLCFLNGDIYNAPITKYRYITNSKRKF